MSISVTPNTGLARTGSLMIAGQTINVTQQGQGAPLQFNSPATVNAGGIPQVIAVADFNRDGQPDIAIGTAANTVQILINKGNGAFGNPTNYNVPGSGLIAADFNGDGYPDLVSGTGVSINKGDGTFGTPLNFPIVGEFVAGFAAADFFRDGHMHLVVQTVNTAGQGPGISLYRNLGNGQMIRVSGNVLGAAGDMIAADVNRDGYPVVD